VLQTGVVIGPGATNLNIDIPVSSVSATITLGGKPLPTTNEYGMDTELYLVSKDTGQWHTLATFDYTVGTISMPTIYGPTVNPRLVPGTYDLWYCHQCDTTTGAADIALETDASDAFPRGLRVLQTGVVVGPGATQLAVDIPVVPTSASVTLAGRALPATNEYGMDTEIYLVSRDTGEWHTLATFDYTVGTISMPTIYGPTVDPRLVPGTYDVLYCHQCGLPGKTAPIAQETDATDAFPRGLRILQSCVTLP
jgi:hypothetical protein